jgi:hypothetical protein
VSPVPCARIAAAQHRPGIKIPAVSAGITGGGARGGLIWAAKRDPRIAARRDRGRPPRETARAQAGCGASVTQLADDDQPLFFYRAQFFLHARARRQDPASPGPTQLEHMRAKPPPLVPQLPVPGDDPCVTFGEPHHLLQVVPPHAGMGTQCISIPCSDIGRKWVGCLDQDDTRGRALGTELAGNTRRWLSACRAPAANSLAPRYMLATPGESA